MSDNTLKPILKFEQIGEMGFKASRGKIPPLGDLKIIVLFRCGYVSRNEFMVGQIRWGITGMPWDAIGYKLVD